MVSLVSVVGLWAFSGGLLGYFFYPLGVRLGVKWVMNLAENGMVYPAYMKPPFPSESRFYLFAIENPREVLRGDRMQFSMKGPYVYRTYLEREGIKFSSKQERVTFDSRRRMYLEEGRSSSMEERMWLMNPILPGTVKSVRSLLADRLPFQRLSQPILFQSVNALLDSYKERLIMRTTPNQFLQGRPIELLIAVTSLAARFGLDSLVPPGPPKNIFGLAFAQNETLDRIEIYTGLGSSADRFAEVARWKDKSEVDVWRGKCRRINGTNGELYKPFLEEGEPIPIFLGPMCRSFPLEPVLAGEPPPGTVIIEESVLLVPKSAGSSNSSRGPEVGAGANGSVSSLEREELTPAAASTNVNTNVNTSANVNTNANTNVNNAHAEGNQALLGEHRPQSVRAGAGLQGLEYELSPSLYMGARSNPSNRCFCEHPRALDCQLDGLVTMGPCFFGAPLFFARPNFKGADARILNTTSFLQTVGPNALPDKQSFLLDQTTGTVLAVNLTLMGVFKLLRQRYMRDLERLRNVTYAPSFATSESVQLPDQFAMPIYMLQQANQYHRPVCLVAAAAGLLLLLLGRLFRATRSPAAKPRDSVQPEVAPISRTGSQTRSQTRSQTGSRRSSQRSSQSSA